MNKPTLVILSTLFSAALMVQGAAQGAAKSVSAPAPASASAAAPSAPPAGKKTGRVRRLPRKHRHPKKTVATSSPAVKGAK